MSASVEKRNVPTSASARDAKASNEFDHHYECRREIAAPAEALFAHLDDHNRLSGHMRQSSWMMAGSRMEIELDAGQGKAVGSHIALKGRVVGLPLSVEEIVTERSPPSSKTWQTVGTPRLLIIGHYRMGFDITPRGPASQLRVFIDYADPEGFITRLLGRMLGGVYSRWCTSQMADDAVNAFARDQGARSD